MLVLSTPFQIKMKFLVLAGLVALTAGSPSRPAFNPDTLMFNNGMLGGDIAGGMYQVATDLDVSK